MSAARNSAISRFAVNDRFGRTCQHVDRAIEAHQFLRRGDKAVAWADDLVDPCDALRAISQRRDGLRSSATINFANAQQICGRQRHRLRMRRHHDRFAATPATCAGITVISRSREVDNVRPVRNSQPIPADARSAPVHRPADFLRHARRHLPLAKPANIRGRMSQCLAGFRRGVDSPAARFLPRETRRAGPFAGCPTMWHSASASYRRRLPPPE